VPIEKVFGAADVVLITPSDDAGVRPILITMAMAAQRPIVASTVASVCELIEDRHTAMLIRDANPRSIAGRVMACFDDPQAAWKLADRARAEVYDHFTITKMLAKLEGVYATFRTSVQASGLTKTL